MLSRRRSSNCPSEERFQKPTTQPVLADLRRHAVGGVLVVRVQQVFEDSEVGAVPVGLLPPLILPGG